MAKRRMSSCRAAQRDRVSTSKAMKGRIPRQVECRLIHSTDIRAVEYRKVGKMIIMAKNRYPATSAKDFFEKAMVELRDNPYPEFIKRTYYFKFGEGGLVMYIIYEIDPGNEEAAQKDLNERVFKFMQEVEGFEQVSVEILMSIQEAITIVQEGALPTTWNKGKLDHE